MNLSETEARKKRCTPIMVINLMEKERFEALTLTGGLTTRCIGSDCMQWRETGANYIPGEQEKYGYCGLAGKP